MALEYMVIAGVAGVVATTLTAWITMLPLLVAHLLGFNMYELDHNGCIQLMKYLANHRHVSSYRRAKGCSDEPSGIILGKWFVCSVTKMYGMDMGWVFTTESLYKTVTSVPDGLTVVKVEESGKKRLTMSVVNIVGSYKNRQISFTTAVSPDIEPTDSQREVVEAVQKFYDEHGYAVVFIEGAPGVGKSTIARFLAREYAGVMCSCYDMTSPIITLSNVVHTCHRTASGGKAPAVIVCVDEIDNIITNIHNGAVREINHPIEVTNKSQFTRLLDSVKFLENTILLLTSNTSREKIDELDPAYLRKHRVNLHFVMRGDLPCEAA